MLIDPQTVPDRTSSIYPQIFRAAVQGRAKKALGNAAGLKNFGVNLVRLEPGSCSALRHWHSHQDEFIYVLAGELTLVTDAGNQILTPGMAAGFPAGEANGHQLVNHSTAIALYLEIGDRTQGDCVTYPDADLIATASQQGWVFTHEDGSPYDS